MGLISSISLSDESGTIGNIHLFTDSIRIHYGKEVYVFDLEGRPIFIYFNDRLYVRGLSGVIVEKKWLSIRPKRRFLRKIDDEEERRKIIGYTQSRIRRITSMVDDAKIKRFLGLIMNMDYKKLEEEARVFREIYKPISILPPDQYLSLVIQLVEGCPYNRCSFCTFYRDRRFRLKDFNEFERHVKMIRKFIGKGYLMRRKIFLADANSMIIPTRKLLRYLDIIYKYFNRENIEGIYSFSDYFHKIKDTEDYMKLRDKGIRRIYIGLESGSEKVLRVLNKPGSPEKAIELVRRCKESGINVGVILLVGAGGKKYYDDHIHKSIDIIKSMPLTEKDIIYLSRLKVYPDTPYYLISKKYGIEILEDEDMDLQINEFVSSLGVGRDKPIIAEYDIDEFVY